MNPRKTDSVAAGVLGEVRERLDAARGFSRCRSGAGFDAIVHAGALPARWGAPAAYAALCTSFGLEGRVCIASMEIN